MNTRRDALIRSIAARRRSDIILVLEDIHDPHNAAAIMRTCDAMGIQHVWFVFEKEEPYEPGSVGGASSSSANKWLNFKIFRSTKTCIDALRSDGFSVIATALADHSEPLDTAAFPETKIALLVGNEHRGLSQKTISMSDRVIRIPMKGFVQSLNVSVATALVLWEITRHRKKT